jgi:hypothetical protein
MERGHRRLNALLIAVACSLGVLIGIVGAARREPGRNATPRMSAEATEPYYSSTRTELAPAELPGEPSVAPEAPSTAPEPAPQQGAHVTGIVFLPDGSPAANARIVLGKQHARADAEGRFELTAPERQPGGDLVAFLSGYEPALHAAFATDLAPGASYQARLVLGPPTTTLSGHVRDSEGRPMKNWTVELDGRDPLADLGLRESVRTDAEGAFTLTDIAAGVHVVRAWKGQHELARTSDPVEAGSDGVIVIAPAEAR